MFHSAGVNESWEQTLKTSIESEVWSPQLAPIADKIANGVPLNLDDGMKLYLHHDLHELGHLAHLSKKARFGDRVFFNSNVHINQTNICVLAVYNYTLTLEKCQHSFYVKTLIVGMPLPIDA